MLLTAIVFLIILSALVLIHEFGHFLVAKKFNIKVEEFGYGLPPRIWGIKRGETLYSINWLPIGGFVKLYGEDEAGAGTVKRPVNKLPKKDLDRAFFSRSVGQRAAVVVAGVVMNTLLAVLIFYIYMLVAGFHSELPLLSDHKFYFVDETVRTEVLISEVQKGSPADKAGMPDFTKVTAVNGRKVTDVKDFISVVNANKGKPVTISWLDQKTQKEVTKQITPRVNPPKGQGAIGVSLFAAKTAVLDYKTPAQKVFSGVTHPTNLLLYNFDLVGKLIRSAIKEHNAAPLGEGVAGPVGIFSLVGTIVQIPDMRERILQILNLAGILSISLAFFNVLPIPALDGGRLFFIILEGVTRRKINPKYEALAHSIGMAILLTLILIITFNDIFKFFR